VENGFSPYIPAPKLTTKNTAEISIVGTKHFLGWFGNFLAPAT
jgi:hypothetical protein